MSYLELNHTAFWMACLRKWIQESWKLSTLPKVTFCLFPSN